MGIKNSKRNITIEIKDNKLVMNGTPNMTIYKIDYDNSRIVSKDTDTKQMYSYNLKFNSLFNIDDITVPITLHNDKLIDINHQIMAFPYVTSICINEGINRVIMPVITDYKNNIIKIDEFKLALIDTGVKFKLHSSFGRIPEDENIDNIIIAVAMWAGFILGSKFSE